MASGGSGWPGEWVVDLADCWVWKRSTDADGYGGNPQRLRRAHRVIYEAVRGPIEEGHELHHLCENKRCVNPAHLVALTKAEHSSLPRPRREPTAKQRQVGAILRKGPASAAFIADAVGFRPYMVLETMALQGWVAKEPHYGGRFQLTTDGHGVFAPEEAAA